MRTIVDYLDHDRTWTTGELAAAVYDIELEQGPTASQRRAVVRAVHALESRGLATCVGTGIGLLVVRAGRRRPKPRTRKPQNWRPISAEISPPAPEATTETTKTTETTETTETSESARGWLPGW